VFTGQTLGRYQITAALGVGGMGEVYRATDTTLEREVAIKVLPRAVAANPDRFARFRREARVLASLNHPNIAAIYDFEEADGVSFLTLELVEGEDLAQRLRRAPIPINEALEIAKQVAEALEAAHERGIIHRDLKPANLMLTRGRRLKLLDFGLALWEGSSRLTDVGGAVGTVAYMAPEQLRGEEVDARADLWSFGAVLYEMLAGRPPFLRGAHGSLQDLMQTVLEKEPPPLREARPDTPAVLARIIERCLQKDPAARYANAGEIVNELQGAAQLTDPHPRPDRDADGLRPGLLVVAGILLVFVLAVGHRVAQKGSETIQVVVLEPEVQGLPSNEAARLTSSLQRAIRDALHQIERVAVVDGQAQEQVSANAYCGPQVCQVILHRLDARDGRELWTESLQMPVTEPADLALQMGIRLRQAYPAQQP
jgi:serine/threonine protein kinase